MLKHIALEVVKNDIQDFYVGILGGSVLKQFNLNDRDTEQLFEFRKTMDVYNLELNGTQFELFVHESLEYDSICHVCLESSNAKELYDKAKENGYWHSQRNADDNRTYFIRDKNRNMFELKKKYT